MDKQEIIQKLVEQTIEMTKQWENKNFGSYTSWFKIFNAIIGFINAMKQDITQVDKIKIGLDAVEMFAQKYAAQYRDKLNDKEKEILEIFISGNGGDILESSNNFVQDVLDKMDTNKDGEVSSLECKNYCRKMFCCAPIPDI
jgi:hypothetical protein